MRPIAYLLVIVFLLLLSALAVGQVLGNQPLVIGAAVFGVFAIAAIARLVCGD